MSSSQQVAPADPHSAAPIRLGPPVRPGQLGSLDRFEILREIGRGGMGVVYLGRDTISGKQVAIKLIQPAMSRMPRAVHRFLVEARHMSRLASPHILPVLEVCERAAGPYFVMPHMERGSLCRHIHPGRPLPAADATRIARQVAEALQFAHAKGVIHHDLKSDNILLGADGNAYVSDFGLARSVFADSFVDVGLPQREGTAPYMAPEIARGEAGDTRADIYSWGVILYEMLTGDLPHEGKSREAVFSAILNVAPRPITQRNPTAPAKLAKVADWAMAPDARNRYATFGDVLADLDRAVRGDALTGPGTPRSSTGRFPSRAARVLIGLTVVTLGVVATIVGTTMPHPGLEMIRQFQPWKDTPDGGVAIGDWDADGELDVVYVEDGRIAVRSAEDFELLRANLDTPNGSPATLIGLLDVAGSTAAEPILISQVNSDAYLTALNQHMVATRRWMAVGAAYGNDGVYRRTSFGKPCIVDLDHDGRREMFGLLGTSHRGGPRHLLRLDPESRPDDPSAPIWSVPMAANPRVEEAQQIDLDNDGDDELLVGTNCSGNVEIVAPDGTTDFQTHLWAIDLQGRVVWRTAISDLFTTVHPLVADLDRNGDAEIYAWVGAAAPDRKMLGLTTAGRLLLFDRKGACMAERVTASDLCSALIVPPAQAVGPGYLVVSDYDGRVHQFGPNLEPRFTRLIESPRFTDVEIRLRAVVDLDGDGDREIVATVIQRQFHGEPGPGHPDGARTVIHCHRPRVIVLDENLDRIAECQLTDRWKNLRDFEVVTGKVDASRKPSIFIVADKAYVFRMR